MLKFFNKVPKATAGASAASVLETIEAKRLLSSVVVGDTLGKDGVGKVGISPIISDAQVEKKEVESEDLVIGGETDTFDVVVVKSKKQKTSKEILVVKATVSAVNNLLSVKKEEELITTTSVSPTNQPVKPPSSSFFSVKGSSPSYPTFPTSHLALKPNETMFSTKLESTRKRAWLAHAKNKNREENRSYCSSDGSSTGWHSCVYVFKGSDKARLVAKHIDHEGSRNVGAEAAGFLLAVETLPVEPEDCKDVVFLVDFLNALAFDCGSANCKAPILVNIYKKVNQIKKTKGFTVEGKTHRWSRIHHPGHQKDYSSCWFTKLNVIADYLAGYQKEIDITVDVSDLEEICRSGLAYIIPAGDISEKAVEKS